MQFSHVQIVCLLLICFDNLRLKSQGDDPPTFENQVFFEFLSRFRVFFRSNASVQPYDKVGETAESPLPMEAASHHPQTFSLVG
jgi:hypothetical protein